VTEPTDAPDSQNAPEPRIRGNYPTPSSTKVFSAILRWDIILAVVIAVVGGVIGYLVDGWSGAVSALIGTALVLVFAGITVVSILVANRFTASPIYTQLFFIIVLGSWMLKFVLFIVIVLLLRGQPWTNGTVLFLSIVAAVIGSLVVDVVVVARTRMSYASDVRLPSGE
jgi:magnesium-transporting ATPase (P-type)